MKTSPSVRMVSSAFSARRLASWLHAVAMIALFGLLARPAGTAHAGTATWNGGAGNWSDATQWTSTTGSDFPNNGNAGQNWDAAVGSGTDTLDINIGIQNFALSGGIVTGSANLTVNQAFTWTGGMLGATGTTFALGGISMDSSGSGEIQLSQGTLVNAAGQLANFIGTGNLDIDTGAALVNSGTFAAQNDQSIENNLGGGGSFNNTGSGTFTVNAGAGMFTAGSGITFNNNGAVVVQTGTFSIQGGGAGSGGFSVSSGAVLQFNGPVYTASAPTAITGAGIVDLNNGALSGTASFNSALTLSGTGTLAGGVITFSPGGATIDASNSGLGELQLDFSTLTTGTGQTVTYVGTGAFDLGDGATIINSGTFVAQNDQTIYNLLSNGGSFNNTGTGTLVVDAGAAGTFSIGADIPLNSSGAINVLTGTLSVQGGGSASGSITIASGAVFQILGSYNLAAPSSFGGAGMVDFNIATLSGTTTFNSALTLSGPGTWAGGQLTFSPGGVTMDASNSGFAEFQLNGSTLTNAAGQTTTYIGTGNFDLGNGAAIINSGTFVAQGIQTVYNLMGGSGAFNNLGGGTFLVQAGAGTFDFDDSVTFSNAGTVNVQTGTLELDSVIAQHSGSTLTGGVWVVSDGATLFFNDGGPAITTNDADVTLGGPNAVFAAIDSIAVNNGAFRVLGYADFTTAGSFTNSGALQLGGGTFNSTGVISDSGSQIFGFGMVDAPVQLFASTLLSAGTGAAPLIINGAVTGIAGLITAGPGMVVLSSSDAYLGGTTVTSGTLQLGNAYSLGAATGSLAINNGTLDLDGFSPTVAALTGGSGALITTSVSGTATLGVSGTASTTYAGSINAGAGAITLSVSGDTLNLTGSSNLGGNLLVANPGAVRISSRGAVSDAGGTVAGTATVSGSGSKWTNSGDVTIGSPATGTLTVNSAGAVADLDGYIGSAAGTTALVTVTGTGSTWTNSKNLIVGGSGAGTLNITIAGVVTSGSATIGQYAGSTGAATVSGPGSRWSNVGGGLTVGNLGTGTLTVTNGGVVSDTAGTVASGPGANGTVAVSGLGSAWTNSGALVVGGSGAGVLNITLGGAVSDTAGTVANSAGMTSTVTVSGLGSAWTNSATLVIGGAGPGVLNISGGGAVTDSTAFAGYGAGSSGTVTVSGSGSSWKNTANLFVGNSQSGILTLTGGGLASVTGAATIGSAGTLQFDGLSTFTAGSLAVNGGTLRTLGAATFAQPATLGAGGMNVDSDGFNSTFSGAFGGTGGLVKLGAGTLTLAGSNSYSGGATLTAGALQLGNASGLGAATGSLSLIAGTLDLHGFSPTVGALSGSSGSIITDLAPGASTLTANSGLNTLYAGQLSDGSGGLALVKSGAGTLTLSGSDNYSGGTTVMAGTVQLGNASALGATTGSLAVNGGTLDLHGFSPTVGSLSGSSGALITTLTGGATTLTVTGPASTLYAGRLNAGSGQLGLTKNGGGTLTLTGSSSLGGNLVSGSLGAVQISAGGVVADSSGIAGYGGGAVTVTGLGSAWTSSNAVEIGDLGSGTLSITAGGAVSSAGVSYLGVDSASSGGATVSGIGSKWTSANSLEVGDLGAGTLAISAGGVVTTASNSYLGAGAGSSGAVTVTGSGSKWTTAGTLYDGDLGSGTLTVTAAGTVSDYTGDLGFGAGSRGVATVSGSGSAWTTTLNLSVGLSGTGTLTVTAGGVVSDGNGLVGTQAGDTGTVTVSGSGSKWATVNNLEIGDLGTGSLAISGGGAVSDTLGYLGFSSSATASVSGTGSTWTNSGDLVVGYSGTGTLTVTGGGAISSVSGANNYLGFGPGSSGVVTVSGAGSKWTDGGNLIVGNNGAGTLSIVSGGLVSVTGTTTIGTLGTLQFDGASTFSTGSMAVNGGAVVTLGATAFTPSATLGTGGVRINTDGFNSTFSGNFSGAGGLAKSGVGTLTLSGSSTYTGATSVNAGTLALATGALHTAALGNSAITVAFGATFAPTLGATHFSATVNAGLVGTGTSGATLTLGAGAALSMVDGAIGTFNLQQNTSFAGVGFVIGAAAGTAPTLSFELGNAALGTDKIAVSKTVSLLATGAKIIIDPLATDTSVTLGNYNLITALGGLGGAGFTLSSNTVAIDGTSYTLSLANSTATSEILTISHTTPSAFSLAAEETEGLADGVAVPVAESVAPAAAVPSFAAPAASAQPALNTTVVPEPENWASGIAALGAVLLMVRRSRMRKRC